MKKLSACVVAGLGMVILASASLSGQNGSAGHLTVYGDLVYFFGPGKPLNCTMSNRYKKGDPVGFRATAVSIARMHPGVRGWVRNLSDGRVELYADGTEAAVDAYLDAVRRYMADHIDNEDVFDRDSDPSVSGFRITH